MTQEIVNLKLGLFGDWRWQLCRLC